VFPPLWNVAPVTISPPGINEEAFGTATIGIGIQLTTGIASGEAFGPGTSVQWAISPESIDDELAPAARAAGDNMGVPLITQVVIGTEGIPSEEAFGDAIIMAPRPNAPRYPFWYPFSPAKIAG